MKRPNAVILFLLLAACVPGQASAPESAAVATTVKVHTTIWKPALDTTFQMQFTGTPVDTSVDADVYDVDLFDTNASSVAELHGQGKKVICYMSAGSWENWRPDADQFPAEVIGRDYAGWPDEKWLNIRRIDLLAPSMRARLDSCAAKGFDAVEPDNIEIYDNNTGFPLTYEDQLNYAIWLADEAHVRGLAIGLKNVPDMAADALPYFDFAITEDCFYYGWCEDLLPFIRAGKPVFAVEYTDMDIGFNAACEQAKSTGFNRILKNRNLDTFRLACPG